MPRDYVKSRSRPSERSGPSGVVWLLMGVLIGLIIAGVFYVKNQKQHPKPLTVPEPQLQQKAAESAAPQQQLPNTTAKTQAKQPAKPPSTQKLQTQFDFYNVLPSQKVIGPSGDEETTEIQSQNAANAAAANTDQNNPPPAATAPTTVSAPEHPKAVEPKIKSQPKSQPAHKQLPPVIQAEPAPKPKAFTPPPSAASAKSSDYIVQVAALSDASDADQLKAQLTLLGFNVNITSIDKNGKTYHRVWLGSFHSKSEAESAHKQLQENMISSQVLKSGS